MKRNFGIVLLIGLFFICNFSCKKDSSITDMGYNYAPDNVGRYVVYDVDSTFYDDFFIPVKVTNYKFQIKEKIQSVFTDNQNRPTIRLERYRKNYDSLIPYSAMSWVLTDVWEENKTATTFEKVEENVRFVRLLFPTRKAKTWNANAQNIKDQRDFDYEYVDLPQTVGNITFTMVLQTLYDDGGAILTNREYITEKYARDVGMIYRQEIDVESQPKAGATVPELQAFYAKTIMQRITSGFQYSMTVNSYGTE